MDRGPCRLVCCLASYVEEGKDLDDVVPCPFIMGIGTIVGLRIAIHGDDFRINDASVARLTTLKQGYFAKMARSLNLPIVNRPAKPSIAAD